jgi:hypothetical protein
VEAEVLNCGIPGLDAMSIAALLEHRVLPQEPDVVVYVFVFNDGEPFEKPLELDGTRRIDAFADFPARSALLQFAGTRARTLLRALRGGDAGSWVRETLADFDDGGRERVERALRRMKDRAAARAVPLLVASYPYLSRPDKNPFRRIDAVAAELCRERELPFVDLTEAFDPAEDLTSYWASPFDAHPEGDANDRAAALIARRLLSLGFVK